MTRSEKPCAPGDLVAGRYLVEGLLGEGGMGSVYLARQLHLDRPVALKLMLPHVGAHADARRRFEREARVAATLRHPGAVTIYDFGDDDGRLYLAMERLRGRTLREAIHGVAACGGDIDLVFDVAAQVCDVLVAAHGIGLVHRDLKPENIFLEPTERGGSRVVVVDFGLAFIENQEEVGRMTREGVVTGTPEYMSPEQVRAHAVGAPADVYALGCVLFEMITGDVPFRGSSHFETVSLQVYAPPPSIRDLCPEARTSSELESLVHAMLHKAPSERPTAVEAAGRFRELAAKVGRRERGKDERSLATRATRMIPRPRPSEVAETLVPGDAPAEEIFVAVEGVVPAELARGLAVNGVRVAAAGEERVEAIFGVDLSVDRLEGLVAAGRPVIADAAPADLDRLSELLAAGVAEVVAAPVQPGEAARKIWRAVRKKRRSESRRT